MDVSVSQFRADCLELIRQIEAGGEPIDIKRRGKLVAQLSSPVLPRTQRTRPWERLHGSGKLLAAPGESVLEVFARSAPAITDLGR